MAIALLCLWIGAACAQDKAIEVRSDPSGATVEMGAQHGTTPCKLDSRQRAEIVIRKAGYAEWRSNDKTQVRIDAELVPAALDTWVAYLLRHYPVPVALLVLGVPGGVAFALLKMRRKNEVLERDIETIEEAQQADDMSVVGKYRVRGFLGEGSYCKVYDVEHVDTGKVYALKMLKADLVDETATNRFLRECEIGRELECPEVVKVYDYGEHKGSPYMVAELLHGDTLESRMADETFDLDEAIAIMRHLCIGLKEAHHRGVIHRDLKPANIMLTHDGGVKILDFGIAHCMDKQKLTKTGSALGTPNYMSPEHIRNAKQVDARSDLYSMGAIFFEMVAHRPLFIEEDVMATLMAQVTKEAPRLSSVVPGTPPEVDDMVAKLLDKKPARRYQSADEVLSDLDNLP